MRTVLYANRAISSYLNESYVLLWTSERPVPKVTIDFGDGRKLERTITGNSVHYVLDAQGRPLDAIPGLYAPMEFLGQLHAAEALHKSLAGADREAVLRAHHASRLAVVEGRFAAAVAEAGKPVVPSRFDSIPAPYPDAEDAIEVAIGKSAIERPMVRMVMRHDRAALEASADTDVWARIVAANATLGGLDSRSIALMARELPGVEITPELINSVHTATDPFAAIRAARRATSKSFRGGEDELIRRLSATETSLVAVVASFQRSLVEDSLRNEFLLHSRVHEWFAAETQMLEPLNERVFRELFLTPRSDPWLGLVPADGFSGITDGGMRN